MYDRAQEVFEAALDVPDADREAFVAGRCGDDAELRRLVLALLAEDDAGSGGFLDGERAAVAPGREIGPYMLQEVVGEGGMGTVFRAEQSEPIARTVAVKVIRAGFDSQDVVARFEAERRALARMDHPNIARVLDAGATDGDRPFVAMEYVDGVSITRYASERDLDVEARVRLWIQVCEAIQHAHQKGVLHRDIKPSNVLVTVVDGRPAPKVIDFGLARALDEGESGDAGLTRFGQALGTPSYMSPEQAATGGRDVDSRTDIYALGVLGYELLTGAPPLDRETVSNSSWPELVRMIQERQAERPSERVADPALRRALRGDLDWVVQKALEKERERRYSSASELAADLGRHLRKEPVTAGPPSVGYVVRRFVSRNRLVVGASVALALALVGGLATTIWQAARATEAEARERGLRVRAERAQRIADAVNDFLVGVFKSADPREQGSDVKVADRLAAGVEQVEKQFADDPEVAAEILATIGVTYRSLSMLEEAERALRRSLELWDEVPEARARRKAHALNALGILCNRRGEEEAAAGFFERSLEGFEASAAAEDLSFEERRGRLDDVAKVSYNLAQLWIRNGKTEPAVPLFERCVEINREYFPDDHVRLGIVLGGQGTLHMSNDDFVLAKAAFVESLASFERSFDRPHPYVAVANDNLSNVYWGLGDYEAMAVSSAAALAIAEEVYGPEHNLVTIYLRRRGRCLLAEGREAEAEPLLRRAVDLCIKIYGEKSIRTGEASEALARSLLASDPAAASEYAARSLEVVRDGHRSGSVRVVDSQLALALARLHSNPSADVTELTEDARAVLAEGRERGPGQRQRITADLERIDKLSER